MSLYVFVPWLMQCAPEPTGAVRFFHNVNNIKLQFRKYKNGLMAI